MNARLTLSALAILTLITAAGCDGRRGGAGGDDDDAAGGGLAGLDQDGDGVFTDDDLASGSSGVYTTTTNDDGETVEGETTSAAWISSGDGYWALGFETSGVYPMSLVVWFADPDSEDWELSTGSGDLGWTSASSSDWLVWESSSSGTVNVTDVSGGKASGWFDGSINLVVADQSESQVGTVSIEGFAFNEVSMAVD